ncbi:G patch domain-containing protein 4-like [Pecten maximus]|uniref:G patch domain-containing protein 4-like n=1 Tax=Pecten maximus TaxID=6579 RepID=UPI001458BC10|nr:G patch domain-containing protein 4-like [Pecten maximus]
MSDSKFALEQLSKHGWKEGSGLGKSESGIKEAIKVKLKHDTHGVGHSKGDEFAFHWWDHVFNKAASNISVNSTEDGVKVNKSKDTKRISTTTTKTFDNKAMLYGKFLKGATLSNGNYEATNVEDSEDEESEEETKPARIQDIDDAELLKACGGMTGHKAARHGHKLNGKLARIEEQEALLLAKYKTGKTKVKERENVTEDKIQNGEDNDILQNDCSPKEIKKKGKKDKSERKKRKREKEDLECVSAEEAIDTDSICNHKKQRCDETSETMEDDTDTRKKKKKEKKRKSIEISDIVVEDNDCDRGSNKRKKKDKKQKSDVCETELSDNDSKKKKKKDLKRQSFEDETPLNNDLQDDTKTKKKKSKKRKKEKSSD